MPPKENTIESGLTPEQRLIALAKRQFKNASDAEQENRTAMLDDMRFRALEQWPLNIKQDRDFERKPCLTMDRTNQFVRQVVNDIAQNRPAPKVVPIGSGANEDTAQVFQGIYRDIERRSEADTARLWALDHAVAYGVGYYVLRLKYVDDADGVDAFDQEIIIDRIKYQMSVVFDPYSEQQDGSDAKFAFIVTDLTREEFEERWPDSELVSIKDWNTIGNAIPGWFMNSGRTIRIAEWFNVETEMVPMSLLSTGEIVPSEQLPEGAEVVKERTVEVRRVIQRFINGVEVLEEHTWPGKTIPIIRVLGEELVVDGKTIYSGMIRRMKDQQRQFNYMRSAQVEAIALAPKAPWVAAAGQTEQYSEWGTANIKSHAVLRYDPVTVNQQLAPPPQRSAVEPAIQAITLAAGQAAEDLKASVGMYDASLGQRSNERSGRAILARQRESDNGNFHYTDNYRRAETHEAKTIIQELIPAVYDRPGRVARIIRDDDTEQTVVLNEPYNERGKERTYDLTNGRYAVTVVIGPSFSTRRMEAAESMMQLAQAYPEMMRVAGDIITGEMDFPGARRLSKRLEKTLPPGLVEDKGALDIPPQAQAMLQQQAEAIEALTQQLDAVTEDIRTEKIKYEYQERIKLEELQNERLRIEADLKIAMLKIDSTEAITQLREELATIRHRIDTEQKYIEMERAQEEAQEAAATAPAAQ